MKTLSPIGAVLVAVLSTPHVCHAVSPTSAGNPIPRICIAENASETVREAAEELQCYLGKICGETLPIQQTANPQRPAFIVGPESASPILPDAELTSLGPEDSLCRTLPDGTIVLTGSGDAGTLNAVYDLLDRLGVRWFMPGEFGEYVPRVERLAIPHLDQISSPSFLHRGIWAAVNRIPAPLRLEYSLWQRRNRMPGALTGSTGHAYARIVNPRDEALFAEHPEYFALVNGKRVRHGQICTTHPHVIERAKHYARNTLSGSPGTVMVSLSPNDGYNWCECARCKAEGTPSDNALTLANHVADVLAEEYPGRMVAMYAYSPTALPPTCRGKPNVIVWVADGFTPKGWNTRKLVQAWSEKVSHLGIREYYSVNAWTWQMPRYYPAKIAEELRYYHRCKALGVNAEAEDNFGANGIAYWIAARLLWNVEQDVDDLLDDYFDNCYGPASGVMRKYWERWSSGAGVSRDRLALALRDLKKAQELAGAHPDVLKRIDAHKTYLHYLRLYREYGQTRPENALESFGKLMQYGFSTLHFHQVAVANVLTRLAIKGSGKRFSVPADVIKRWRNTPPVTADQIKSDFAEDLDIYVPLGLARKTFPGTLQPARAGREAPPCAPAYRSNRNRLWLWVPENHPVHLKATTGLIRNHETVLRLEDTHGNTLDEQTVPPGMTQTIPVDHGRNEHDNLKLAGEAQHVTLSAEKPGLVTLIVEPAHGSACRIDFGSICHAISTGENSPMTFIGGTRGKLYFYVPAGTQAFGVGLKTPDRHARITVFSPHYEALLREKGDYVLGEEFRIDVPPECAGKIWSLVVDKCEDCTLHLIDVPPYAAQTPRTLLIPAGI